MHANTYGLLLDCYLSGQMSQAQFERHKADDEVFRAFAARRMAETRKRAES